MSDGFRQEVLNVLLAQLLQERGVVSAPETLMRLPTETQLRMPDVIVDYMGLRTVIEGEVADQPRAEAAALDSARKRVEEAVAHIGIAIVYPASLRTAAFPSLKSELERAELRVAVVTESGETGYSTATPDALESILRQTFENLVKEDAVARAVALLDASISRFAYAIVRKAGIVGRCMKDLGISELPKDEAERGDFRVPMNMSERQRLAVSHICGLVLVNALIFQEILSQEDDRVLSVRKLPTGIQLQHTLQEHWQFIIEKINYSPIFHLAREVLANVSAYAPGLDAARDLAKAAGDVVGMRAPLRHDLMGRVYHRLLVEAKYLGTYYTSIPAAALLLKLALRANAWKTRWHDLEEVRRLRVADLACGTGTLLMAAAEAITDNYVSAAAGEREEIDTARLQAVLAEDVLHGYDVLPSALHLTASTLALRAPKITFRKMNLYSLPLGGPGLRLGSIEYLIENKVQIPMDVFGFRLTKQGLPDTSVQEPPWAGLPHLDLCVMNPPFTRSSGGNLLFGSLPEDQRRQMQEKLKNLVKRSKALASITAGLGSVFVAAADPYIKQGGRIALVLPKAILSGVAWEKTRSLLTKRFRLEYVVASHDPQRWNFSESTDLSEVLLVAVKVGKNAPKQTQDHPVVALNLWHMPPTTFEALAVARELIANGPLAGPKPLQRGEGPPDVASGQGALEFHVGKQKLGEAISVPWSDIQAQSSWMLLSAFAQCDLIRAAYHLAHGALWLPGRGEVGRLPVRRLGDLGSLGPDRRDILDGFSPSVGATAYPAFWGRDAKTVYTLTQEPNVFLSPLPRAKKGRPLRKATDLWPRAGRVLIAGRLRLNTQSVSAVRLSKPVLSNVWSPFSFKEKLAGVRREKALVLWANSTLGLLLLLLSRVETEGPWIEFKKSVLARLLVIDLERLPPKQINHLAAAYDRLAREALQPFPAMADDRVRAEIDKAVAEALRLPDFSILREMLAREPVVCLKPL